MFFNRYTANTCYVRNALNKKDLDYCAPENYHVSEKECLKYLDDIAIGQRNNDNWNSKRKKTGSKYNPHIMYYIVFDSFICFIVFASYICRRLGNSATSNFMDYFGQRNWCI